MIPHFVENAAECPVVTVFLVGFALDHFWRLVQAGSNFGLCELGRHRGLLCEPKVAQKESLFAVVVFRYQDVGRLDITMQNALRMHEACTGQNLAEPFFHFIYPPGPKRAACSFFDSLEEITSICELHHDINVNIGFKEKFASYNIGVPKSGQDGDFVDQHSFSNASIELFQRKLLFCVAGHNITQ